MDGLPRQVWPRDRSMDANKIVMDVSTTGWGFGCVWLCVKPCGDVCVEELASILQDLLLRQLAEAGHGDHGNKVKQDIGSSNSIPG